MVLRVTLSLKVALLDSLSVSPTHKVLIAMAELVSIACYG